MSAPAYLEGILLGPNGKVTMKYDIGKRTVSFGIMPNQGLDASDVEVPLVEVQSTVKSLCDATVLCNHSNLVLR